MSKPFDAITRALLEAHPADWLAMIGLGRGLPARVVDSDLSTITAEADKVLRVDTEEPWLVHVEVQAGYDADLPRRLLRYNTLLDVRHDLPVASVAVLLWPEASGPALTGRYAREAPDGHCGVALRYRVVRVWELSAAALASTPGTLPLVALAARDEAELVALAAPALAALGEPPTPAERELRAALYFLIGRRFSAVVAEELFRGDKSMLESVTYQKVLDEGRKKGLAEEGRRIVLLLGSQRFGPPHETARARLERMSDPSRLETLAGRVLTSAGWDDLLADDS